MDIDMAALRALEREKDLSLSVVLDAIEQALLIAYQRTEGSYARARVELDRSTGHVVVWAKERHVDEDGTVTFGEDIDDTPTDFGRIAAATARQVILQRLRDAEDEQKYGEFVGKEGDLVSGRPTGPRARRRPRRPREARGPDAPCRAGARRALRAR